MIKASFMKRIHSWCEWAQKVEAAENHNGQEQGIVVEDGIGCRFIVSHFIFLPQYPETYTQTIAIINKLAIYN